MGVTTFYMDLQNIGLDFPKFHAEVRRDIKMIRALPGDVSVTLEGAVKLRYLDEDTGRPEVAAFDLVVLAVGIGPGTDNPELAALLDLELSPAGFFQATDQQNRSLTSQPGLFLAGTAEGPKDIAACLIQGLGAARQVSQFIKAKS